MREAATRARPLIRQPPRHRQNSPATTTASSAVTLFPPFTLPTFKPLSLPGDFTFAPPVENNNILADRVKAFAEPNRVLKLLKEVSEYSPVQQNEGDGMRRLMHSFFGAMADMSEREAATIHAAPMNDGTEMGVNRPLSNQLFESDMVLTIEQMKGVILASAESNQPGRRRTKRKVITGGVYRWPKGQPIPYRFKGGNDDEKLVCAGAKTHRPAIILFLLEAAGATRRWVEWVAGQAVSIGYGCDDPGIVTHEVGHSLGFWHEQSRPDRDEYIFFDRGVVIHGTEGNFAKRTRDEIEDMGLPYDLGSVMHYGPTAFTTDWDRHTLVTKNKQFQRTIGQRKGPSFIDVKQVNRLYCNDVCSRDIGCEHGGYMDPNNCQRCKCPPGLGGNRCEKVQESSRECGGELLATNAWQELSFRGKGQCYWRIRTPNARIRYIISKVEYRCEEVCKAFIEIKSNSDFQQTGFRKCCEDGQVEMTSEQSEMLLLHDSTILDYETKFSVRYIIDSGAPIPKPPPSVPTWVPGKENRNFRGAASQIGPVEQFILNVIPKVRDANRPMESVASIATDWALRILLGTKR
ncbi:unnamed protein product, partial [Mesorhabditis spiculigera]